MDTSTVHIGVGLGDIRFGSSIATVEAQLGPADNRQEDSEDNVTSVSLVWDQGIACWFDSDDDYRLGMIQVEHESATMNGHAIMLRPQSEVLDTLRPQLGEPTLVDQSSDDSPDEWLADFNESHGLSLWFEGGRLTAIQWNYLVGDDGETPLWPE